MSHLSTFFHNCGVYTYAICNCLTESALQLSDPLAVMVEGVLPRASAAIHAAVYTGRGRGLGTRAHVGTQKAKNEGKNGNFVCSPFSILLVFAVAMRGARGRTVEEMERLLPLRDLPALLRLTTYSDRSQDEEEVARVAGETAKSEEHSLKGRGIELDVVSRMYVDGRLASNMYFQTFRDDLVRECSSGREHTQLLPVQLIDCNEAETTAAEINAFVAEATRGHITDLVSAELISPKTRLLLVSAAFFKGSWRTPFHENETRKGHFYAADYSHEGESLEHETHEGEKKVLGQDTEAGSIDEPQDSVTESEPRLVAQNVDMMYIVLDSPHQVYYRADDYVQAVGLPYTDSRYVMYIVQPNKSGNLDKLMRFKAEKPQASKPHTSSFPTLEDVVHSMRKGSGKWQHAEVHLSLPRFTLKSTDNYLDLIPLFVRLLQIQAPFDRRIADFSGISGDHTLLMSAFVHQADIQVDEKGTVATAATMAGIALMAAFMPKEQVDITINKPFAFQIRYHPDEGEITDGSELGDYVLFTGCITDALAAQK